MWGWERRSGIPTNPPGIQVSLIQVAVSGSIGRQRKKHQGCLGGKCCYVQKKLVVQTSERTFRMSWVFPTRRATKATLLLKFLRPSRVSGRVAPNHSPFILWLWFCVVVFCWYFVLFCFVPFGGLHLESTRSIETAYPQVTLGICL